MLLQTERMRLRPVTHEDAPFMLALLNEPAYYQNIGDRGVRTVEQCQTWIDEKILKPLAENGFGLLMVTLHDGTRLGFCGLMKREILDDIDIGYAFAAEHNSKGYATEAAKAVLDFARDHLKLKRIAGVVDPANTPSIRVLEKLGLRHEKKVRLSPGDIELLYFARDF